MTNFKIVQKKIVLNFRIRTVPAKSQMPNAKSLNGANGANAANGANGDEVNELHIMRMMARPAYILSCYTTVATK